MNKLRPYIGMIASMLGMQIPAQPLPFHRPYVAFEERTGKGRRTQRSRVNRAHWKCNEINPRTDAKRGHLNDIIHTWYEKDQQMAYVRCRRCSTLSTIKVRTSQYTSNKKVLAARAEAKAA
jgi:DNA-directed RNA polymerase subunit RPC12/RpoP